jgi:hypothetical protein
MISESSRYGFTHEISCSRPLHARCHGSTSLSVICAIGKLPRLKACRDGRSDCAVDPIREQALVQFAGPDREVDLRRPPRLELSEGQFVASIDSGKRAPPIPLVIQPLVGLRFVREGTARPYAHAIQDLRGFHPAARQFLCRTESRTSGHSSHRIAAEDRALRPSASLERSCPVVTLKFALSVTLGF